MLQISAGVMLLVSMVEIFQKSVQGFKDGLAYNRNTTAVMGAYVHGGAVDVEAEADQIVSEVQIVINDVPLTLCHTVQNREAFLSATACFFAGFAFMMLLDLFVHKLDSRSVLLRSELLLFKCAHRLLIFVWAGVLDMVMLISNSSRSSFRRTRLQVGLLPSFRPCAAVTHMLVVMVCFCCCRSADGSTPSSARISELDVEMSIVVRDEEADLDKQAPVEDGSSLHTFGDAKLERMGLATVRDLYYMLIFWLFCRR